MAQICVHRWGGRYLAYSSKQLSRMALCMLRVFEYNSSGRAYTFEPQNITCLVGGPPRRISNKYGRIPFRTYAKAEVHHVFLRMVTRGVLYFAKDLI